MDLIYISTPLTAWLLSGLLKFTINSFRVRKLAFEMIGYGGLPSTHTAIVTSVMSLILLREGVSSPAFGASFAFVLIVIIDAMSLRRQLGKHAAAINRLRSIVDQKDCDTKYFREKMGHSGIEVAAGVAVGLLCAALNNFIFQTQ